MSTALVIIGDANAGKSTWIGHLSGLPRAGTTNLTLQNGQRVGAHVEISALQEQHTYPDDFCTFISRAGAPYTLFPLRVAGIGRKGGHHDE